MELARKPLAQIVQQIEEVGRLVDAVTVVAPSRVPVLLLGPRCTGIDLLAHALHICSPRATRPYVAVHCPAYPGATLENQLLGRAQAAASARTDATHPAPGDCQDAGGDIERANGGTLYIDQIQNASPRVQAEMHRLLTAQEYVDAAEGASHRADIRIVASAWTDLDKRADGGRFRKDLFDRLNVVSLQLRRGFSARERFFEVLSLLRATLNGGEMEPGELLPRSLLDALKGYSWSKEVGTLLQALQETRPSAHAAADPATLFFEVMRTIGRQKVESLAQHHLQAVNEAVERCVETYEFFGGQLYETLVVELEKTLIERVLIQCNGTVARAALVLGVSINMLETRLQELGLQPHKSAQTA